MSKQKLIQKAYAEHMDSLHKVFSLMEQLPNHDKNCDCDQDHVKHIDLDIDWNDGTTIIGCMNCGGYLNYE